MPQLTTVLTQDDLARRSNFHQMDLAPYRDIIEQIRTHAGVGGEVELLGGESQRAEKRRLSLVAKQVGPELELRKSDASILRFVLAEPGQPIPGSRPRRPKSPEPTPLSDAARRGGHDGGVGPRDVVPG